MPDSRQLVLEKLAVHISLVKQDGGIARSDHIAEDILFHHPDCGMTSSGIATELIRMAASVGVAVEIGDGSQASADSQTLQ